jgi:hypothetical protein
MDLRRLIPLAAAAALASQAGAEGNTSDTQQQPPPTEKSQSWYQRDAQKARELGQKGVDATKRGATSAGKAVNSGGQAATAKVVGTKTVTGRIADVSKEEVTVNRSDGTPLKLRVTDSTKVSVGGKQRSVSSLTQGDEVRASYAQSGGSATATKIDVTRTGAASRPARSKSGAAPGSDTGSGSGASTR